MGYGWYDRKGKYIDSDTAARLLDAMEYKRVAEDTVGEFWISTAWLGLDHRHVGEGPPIIFETMVFGPDDYEISGYTKRYCTEAEAREGHKKVVQTVRDTLAQGGDKRIVEV